jgi:hypothetical protein
VFDEMKARPAEAFSALMGVSARIGPEAALLSGSRVLAPAVDYSVW